MVYSGESGAFLYVPLVYELYNIQGGKECLDILAENMFIYITHEYDLVTFFFPFTNLVVKVYHEGSPWAYLPSYIREMGKGLGVEGLYNSSQGGEKWLVLGDYE